MNSARHHLVAAAMVACMVPLCGAQVIVLPALPDTYVPQPPADDALYRQLGGGPGIDALIEVFLGRLLADPRVEPFFRDADRPVFKQRMAVMLCEVSGGPCRRDKHDIRRVHSSMDIARAHFNAVVEALQNAMDAQQIPFGAQNRLLAQLAPMHRDIVNVN